MTKIGKANIVYNGAVAICVEIWRESLSGDMRLSGQAARSIG
jgi:hypothetical protein